MVNPKPDIFQSPFEIGLKKRLIMQVNQKIVD